NICVVSLIYGAFTVGVPGVRIVGTGGFFEDLPPPKPRNNKMMPTTAAVVMIAARMIHLVSPGESEFEGCVAAVEFGDDVGFANGVEFLSTLGNEDSGDVAVDGVGTSVPTGSVFSPTTGTEFSSEVCSGGPDASSPWVVAGACGCCAISGEKVKAIERIHDSMKDDLGRNLISGISSSVCTLGKKGGSGSPAGASL